MRRSGGRRTWQAAKARFPATYLPSARLDCEAAGTYCGCVPAGAQLHLATDRLEMSEHVQMASANISVGGRGDLMTERFGDEDELERARELYDRMGLGTYPAPQGDEFDLFNVLAAQVQWPKTWAGGVLDVKTRSLCTIAALIASGKPQVDNHIRAALAIGASRQEVADLITHIAFYTGFPSAGNAMRAAKGVFAELDAQASDA